MTRPLTHDEKLCAFRRATGGFANAGNRWAEAARTGLSDAHLEEALRYELGIMGGSGGPGQPSLAYQGAGLRIWASWDGINMVQDKPLFAGRATIAMAREVYGIRDPSDRQTSLF
ncbi:MAG: hypothetical protein ACKVP3_24165 [Hyphomicrobiaceae bacterium]